MKNLKTVEQSMRLKLRITKKDMYAYKLVAPAIILFLIVLIWPLLYSLYISLFDWRLLREAQNFVGLRNYVQIITSSRTLYSFQVTGIFMVFTLTGQLIFGTSIALLLNKPFKGQRLVRIILLIPMMVSPAVNGLVWRLILHTESGVANYIPYLLNISPINWLGSKLALPVLITLDLWQTTPFMILVALAGLQSVPKDLIEASYIDGANRFQRFFYITLPIIKPVLLVGMVFRTMFAMRSFPLPWILTAGGPGLRTNLISLELYKQTFQFYNMGLGATISWLLVILTGIISLIYIKLAMREGLM